MNHKKNTRNPTNFSNTGPNRTLRWFLSGSNPIFTHVTSAPTRPIGNASLQMTNGDKAKPAMIGEHGDLGGSSPSEA